MDSGDLNMILASLEEVSILRASEVKVASLLDKRPLSVLRYFNRCQAGKRIIFVNQAAPSSLVVVTYRSQGRKQEFVLEFTPFLLMRKVRKFLAPLSWLMPPSFNERFSQIIEEEEEGQERADLKNVIFTVKRHEKLFSIDKASDEATYQSNFGRYLERTLTYFDPSGKTTSVHFYVSTGSQ